MRRGNVKYIASATTTIVKAGPCILERIVVGTTAAGAIQIYDDPATTNNQIAELKSSIAEGTYVFETPLANGLTIVTAAASKITVVYAI